MDETAPVPTTEDAPVVMVIVPADRAPEEGARVSLDYATPPGGGIGATRLVPNSGGAWVVARVGSADAEGNVTVWLDNTGRPDLPSSP